MNDILRNLFLICLTLPIMYAYATPLAEREALSSALNKDLLCEVTYGMDRAGDPESNRYLTKAGASITITIDEDADYNQFRYSFIKPLEVNSLSLYSVQQMVGEGGTIFIAEVEGNLSGFAKTINAQSAKEDDDFLGVSNVFFYKILKEKKIPDSESEFTKIVVGQNRIQKAQGRFFYGCVETMILD